jgi:hypothetical protein
MGVMVYSIFNLQKNKKSEENSVNINMMNDYDKIIRHE